MNYAKDGHYFYPGYHFCFFVPREEGVRDEREYAAAIEWCQERWGHRGIDPNKGRRTASMVPPRRWMAADYCILIRDYADAFEFRMRWT